MDTEQHCSNPAREKMTPRPPHTLLKRAKHNSSLQALRKRTKGRAGWVLQGMWGCTAAPSPGMEPLQKGDFNMHCAVNGQNTE